VLLGGDGDGYNHDENAIIPARQLYVELNVEAKCKIAADMYYACLDGPYDYNGNEIYGEKYDGNRGEEDVDLLYDVFVGRICAETDEEAGYQINKIIAYESNPAPYKALLLGGRLNAWSFGGFLKELIHEYMKNEYLNNIPKRTRYWKDDNYEQAYHPEWVVEELNSNSYLLINHIAHSSKDLCIGLSSEHLSSLTNTTYPWAYSGGCWAGDFDNCTNDIAEPPTFDQEDCMAEQLLTAHSEYDEHGLSAFIGHSRTSFGGTSIPSDDYNVPQKLDSCLRCN